MNHEQILKIAQDAACRSGRRGAHSYLPTTAEAARDFGPHGWVLDAIRDALRVQEGQVRLPPGWRMIAQGHDDAMLLGPLPGQKVDIMSLSLPAGSDAYFSFLVDLWHATAHLRSSDPTEPAPLEKKAETNPFKVITMRETTLRDVAATLRSIADDLEKEKWGPVRAAALVLDADSVETFFTGDGEPGPCAHLLFSVAAAKMVQRVLDEKG